MGFSAPFRILNMGKAFISELTAWIEKKDAKKKRRDAAAVAFLAVRSDIEEGIAAGYALSTLWEFLHETGKIPYGYDSFRHNVHKYIRNKSPVNATLAAKIPASEPSSKNLPVSAAVETAPTIETQRQDPIVVEPAEKPGFKFNPSRKR